MSYPIILSKGIDIINRWRECNAVNSVMAWRALSNVCLAYSRIEVLDNKFCVASDMLTLSELAQQRAIDLAPFEDMEAA